jgi:hypothetical protein
MLSNYIGYVFSFLAGMVFGVFVLAWFIMKVYNARKGIKTDGPDND